MHSKKSKTLLKTPQSPELEPHSPTHPLVWKEEHGCSEDELGVLGRKLAQELCPGMRVLLEGEMGAGKTTFARILLEALGVEQPPEGSPTFAIAHQYSLGRSKAVVHVDLYRVRSEEEIEERGLPEIFWDAEKLILSEWTSLWQSFESSVLHSGMNWRVELRLSKENLAQRDVRITRLF